MPTRIAVLASGRGSNLRALLDHLAGHHDAEAGRVELIASDRPDAGALVLARERGIAAAVIEPAPAGAELGALLAAHRIGLVVLAGYLQLVPSPVVREYAGRIVNVHPALLPAFGGKGMYGARVHRAVIAAGARVSGATVHFVDESYDRGPIIAQWPVPVFADDTEHTLAARVLRVEHLLLPRVVDAVATGRVALDGASRVRIATGAGLYDHLLEQLAFHAGFDLILEGAGDLETGDHHTAEDAALALGAALDEALGDRRGIARYGDAVVPMDDALARAAVDLGGRRASVLDLQLDPGLAKHMLQSLADSGRMCIHVEATGEDPHHVAEAAFKAVGRALRAALRPEGSLVPSTKGIL
jgi:formyltetrahydrofolate-dependent phosphoribosylglycinamide formyltransferase